MAREGKLFWSGEKDVGRAVVNKESTIFHWLSPCQERSLYSSCQALLLSIGLGTPPSGILTLFNWRFCWLILQKVMTNLDSILKSRDITLPAKLRLAKATVFPVVMYGCESWTIKKAEHWRIDTFELWCWRTLLRVPWTARRSNQSILKEISPEYSLEGLMLKLKLQHFGHLKWRTDSLEKILMLEKT